MFEAITTSVLAEFLPNALEFNPHERVKGDTNRANFVETRIADSLTSLYQFELASRLN